MCTSKLATVDTMPPSVTCSTLGLHELIFTILFPYQDLTEKRRRLITQFIDYRKKKEEEMKMRRKAFEEGECEANFMLLEVIACNNRKNL